MNRELAKANVAVEMLVPTPGLEPQSGSKP